MDDIKAKDPSELLAILMRTGISVPSRTEGRKTEHCEQWAIFRLLATLSANKRLMYPLELIKRERPDFFIKNSELYIGVEVTEATNPDYAKATVLSETSTYDTVIDPSLFKWGTPKRSLEELRNVVFQNKLTGPGWEGDSVEVEYGKAIYDVIAVKTNKLRSMTFEKYRENWLLINCNIVLPNLDIAKANKYLENNIQGYWGKDSYSKVFVDLNDGFICYSPGLTESLKFNNLWSDG